MSRAGAEPRYRVSPGAHAVDLDGELLIWDDGTQQLHRLNPTATRIWHELSSWRSREQIAAALTVGTDVDTSRVVADVAQCVEHLAGAGLLDREGER